MLSDMIVFNGQLQTAVVEKLTQMSNLFNAASGGALILANADNMGDFTETAFWDNVGSSAIRDMDVYAAQSSVSNVDLTQSQINTVKAAKAFGPVAWTPAQLSWINKNPGEALSVISTTLAQSMLEAQVNRAIGAGVAAISNVAGATNDISASAGVTQTALNDTHAKFGDNSQSLSSQIMTGAVYHQLIGRALDNADQLFSEGTVTVIDILGKRTVVTDSPDLYVAGTPNKAHVLCLTPGAIMIEPNGDFVSNIDTPNGQLQLETTYQAQWSENIGIKGYSWDETNGGKSPITAELNTGSNWDAELALKNSAGAILIADADQ